MVTGAAGFIGSAVVLRLLERGDTVIGIDSHNSYYDPRIKEARIARQINHHAYTHLRIDLCDSSALSKSFKSYKPRRVINLAAQAGVRYSIENPMAYIQSNIVGFANILEECRYNNIEHLVYASSSSVYGANTQLPFSVRQNVDHPLSLYAASKKSNELMAHAYSHLYRMPTTGLRFFTVYGPWGRPDMALFKFTKSMLEGKPIQVFNFGHHKRDFTYIDDIVEGIIRVLDAAPTSDQSCVGEQLNPGCSDAPWRVYNIGNSNPVELMEYIHALENSLCMEAVLELLPLQMGDVADTHADVTELEQVFGYKPSTTIQTGVDNFVEWYREYYRV